ncbi:tRNA-specific adenosine deaminase 2 [Porphyridium purpureum]|uniref:tRNA-specific adenosine deaminase 2 n=1 Tax=Porphyridium purpureum TaxID=35688 RepID=A0A5J4Z855_PORPP|nr:tRNA-specific adenosine deaminase 2 [Porphyridium purpureum]|eukprot:POR0950..scf295_1
MEPLDHEWFMREALAEARAAFERGEVPVGCVLVDARTREIVGRGSNRCNERMNATRHAELEAFEDWWASSGSNHKAGNASVELVVYVTVEPCIMCAAMLIELLRSNADTAARRLVVFGCRNERFGGCGTVRDVHTGCWAVPAGEGLEIIDGVLKDEAVHLLERFFEQTNPLAPVPRVKRPRK